MKDKTVSTSALLERLFRTSSFERYREKNASSMGVPSFHEYISELCTQKNEARERVIKRAGIDRVYGHQIFSGRYVPSRDKVIQLAFGLGLDDTGAQTLLKLARKSELYPKVERDAAILYCLHRGTPLIEAQALLAELGLCMLGGDRNDG